MRVHHLNCGTMHPLGTRGMLGCDESQPRPSFVCHCLLIETSAGLVLVDSGLGMNEVRTRGRELGGSMLRMARPQLLEEETALHQIQALGYRQDDVRHIILTHMDLDHSGGLADFPKAVVHVMRAELDAARARRTLLERNRYVPSQWAHAPVFETYDSRGEPWFGFECVRQLVGLPPEVLLIPLGGHSRGHTGVAVDAPGGWLLHCGDAYFHRDEVAPRGHRCPATLSLFQRVVATNASEQRLNQQRLRELNGDSDAGVVLFSAHDPVELAGLLSG